MHVFPSALRGSCATVYRRSIYLWVAIATVLETGEITPLDHDFLLYNEASHFF